MLDPRIYRTGLVLVGLAVVVLAFSLVNQQGPLSATLAPDAYNGLSAYSTMNSLAASYPDRQPGSVGDDALASEVAGSFRRNGLTVTTDTFKARTAVGTRTLETVTGTLTGTSGGSIVIVAHRDALGSPATADLSGTATLIQLAQVLSGETQQHSILLVSTSGSAGAAGALNLAPALPAPVDAVIVLGDLAGSQTRYPIVVPWSDGQRVAPPMLRNTVAAALSSQASLSPGTTSLAGQFAHLALPLTIGEQGPFGGYGYPAVLLSLSGERGPRADEPVQGATRITAMGETVLSTISALEAGGSLPRPSAYLLLSGMVVPEWAIRVFVLALILPVLIATLDGVARARRRGHSIVRWVVWVLASALPFVLAVLVVEALRLTGLIKVSPPGPVGVQAVPLHAAGIAILVVVAVVLVLSFALVRPTVIALIGGEPRAARRPEESSSAGAGAALLLVLCAAALAIWLSNPFAAMLLVPALHLWMWVVDPKVRLPTAALVTFLVVGVAPPVLVVLYYAVIFGLSPVDVAWGATLLFAGGHFGLMTVIEWSVVLGCVVSVTVLAVQRARARRPEEAKVTVRGPITYAGPGSLGGTKSALRR
jgi:hypothetical protein